MKTPRLTKPADENAKIDETDGWNNNTEQHGLRFLLDNLWWNEKEVHLDQFENLDGKKANAAEHTKDYKKEQIFKKRKKRTTLDVFTSTLLKEKRHSKPHHDRMKMKRSAN